MTKQKTTPIKQRENFIKIVKSLLLINENSEEEDYATVDINSPEYEDAVKYLNKIIQRKQPRFTKLGLSILCFLQENNQEYDNKVPADIIAEKLNLQRRAVTTSCNKLIAEGYVTKSRDKEDHILFSLTEEGQDYEIFDNY